MILVDFDISLISDVGNTFLGLKKMERESAVIQKQV